VSGNQKFEIRNSKFEIPAGGFLMAELTIALTVLGILLVCFALSLQAFAQFNSYQLVRQRCIAAAQAELDSIAATGNSIPAEDFQRLWPRLNVSIKKSLGTSQWERMELVKVTTKGKSFRNEVNVKLSRYILTGKTPCKNAGR
jgi:type II secretory pathway pseudopilin PulG